MQTAPLVAARVRGKEKRNFIFQWSHDLDSPGCSSTLLLSLLIPSLILEPTASGFQHGPKPSSNLGTLQPFGAKLVPVRHSTSRTERLPGFQPL